MSLESGTAERHDTLPRGLASLGDIIGLPDGGLLLAFNPDGSLRWERSYEDFIIGSVRLVEQNGRAYLMNDENNTVNLYAVDLNNAALTQVFIGGRERTVWGRVGWLRPRTISSSALLGVICWR